MFKNACVYRLQPEWRFTPEEIDEAVQRWSLGEAAGVDLQQIGWVPSQKGGALVVNTDGQYLLAMRTRRRLLPASVVKQVAEDRFDEVEERTGSRPGKRQRREIVEAVRDELLPKAFQVHRDVLVWIDTRNRWLVIDTSSHTKADEVIGLLAKTFEPLAVESLRVRWAAAGAMTGWLVADEPPASFSVDMDAELRSRDANRGRIRWMKSAIDAADARRHVEAGKQCSRLAMTWSDRISFVLTEDLTLKSIAPLDVLKDSRSSQEGTEDERFMSDFTLMSGELAKLLADLTAALGGIDTD